MTQQEKDALIARIAELKAMGKLSPELQVELDQAESVIALNTGKGSSSASPSTDIIAPARHQVFGKVMDISDPIASFDKSGKALLDSRGVQRSYCIVSFSDQNDKIRTWAMPSGFVDRNDKKLIPNARVSLTIETRIGGKTQWLDKKTGAIGTHNASGENVVGVTLATAEQINGTSMRNIEEKLEAAFTKNPQFATVLATLYQRKAAE